MSENLWGELTEQNTGPSPIRLMREQAAELTKATNGVLIGNAKTLPLLGTTDLNCNLSVRVPGLGNYEVTLVSFKQPLRVYPLTLQNSISGGSVTCASYDGFYNAIKDILSSDETKKVLSGLWLQVGKPN